MNKISLQIMGYIISSLPTPAPRGVGGSFKDIKFGFLNFWKGSDERGGDERVASGSR